jgi:hypothetical protein
MHFLLFVVAINFSKSSTSSSSALYSSIPEISSISSGSDSEETSTAVKKRIKKEYIIKIN